MTSFKFFLYFVCFYFFSGLYLISKMVERGRFELRIDMMKKNGTKGFAHYMHFRVFKDHHLYAVNVWKYIGGNAGRKTSTAIPFGKGLSKYYL